MKCERPKCRESVTIAGSFRVAEVFGPERDVEGYEALHRLCFASPPLSIMEVPKDTPQTVKDAIEAAGRVVWLDPGAAANRLRLAVEKLLTVEGVDTRRATKRGVRSMSTQQRIQRV